MSFNNELTEHCALSPDTGRFLSALNAIEHKESTRLWDAIEMASRRILGYNHPDGRSVRHPFAKQRIVVISDGEDSGSKTTLVQLIGILMENDIVVDGVLVSTSDENEELCVLCKWTGGKVFRVNSLEHGLGLFEQEGFLDLSARGPITASTEPVTKDAIETPIETLKRYNMRVAQMKREHAAIPPPSAGVLSYFTEAGIEAVRQALEVHDLWSPQYAVHMFANLATTRDVRVTRIMREILIIANFLKASPDPNMQVWVIKDHVEEIRVFLKGPEVSPYAGKWWSLFITFPRRYGSAPPFIRFVSVPYHPNVSAEGRLMYDRVAEGYEAEFKLIDILRDVRNVLRAPELDEPVDAAKAELYRSNKAEYDRRARESTANAKDAIEDYPYASGAVHRDIDPPANSKSSEGIEASQREVLVSFSAPVYVAAVPMPP